jgi:hypothetical protein
VKVSGNGLKGLDDMDMDYGIIKAKVHTTLVVYIKEQNYGKLIVIQANITPNTAGGTVVFTINGAEHTNVSTNGVAVLVLEDQSVGHYAVTAKYLGDDTHYESNVNNTSFDVDLVPVNLTIKVNDTLSGQNNTVIVETNAVGSVMIIVNGEMKVVPINNGIAILNVTGLTEN